MTESNQHHSPQDQNVGNKKSTDTTSSFISTQSQVTPKKRWSITELTVWGVVGTLFFVVILNLFLGSSHRKQAVTGSAKTGDYREELQSNLAAIQNQKTAAPTQVTQTSQPNNAPKQTDTADTNQQNSEDAKIKEQMMLIMMQQKEQARLAAEQAYQARLDAPTSLMGDSSNQPSFSNSNNNTTTPQGQPSNTATAVFSGGGQNSAFGNQTTEAQGVSAETLAHPDYTVASGELIPAVLETPIDSDLPGMVRAVISQPIYAYTGNMPLIPAGSRLIGQYSSSISQGQSRIMVIWNRVILPNGITAQLNSPGTDNLGVAGQGADSVNNHFVAQFSEATLLTLIGGGTALAGVSSTDEYNSAAAYRTEIAQNFNQTASTTLNNRVAIQPTLKVNQGAQIHVFVAKDIDFYGVLNGSNV